MSSVCCGSADDEWFLTKQTIELLRSMMHGFCDDIQRVGKDAGSFFSAINVRKRLITKSVDKNLYMKYSFIPIFNESFVQMSVYVIK